MPEPIASNAPVSPNTSYDPEEGQACAATSSQASSPVASATASEPLSRSVSKLVSAVPPPLSALPSTSVPEVLRWVHCVPEGRLNLEPPTLRVRAEIDRDVGPSLGAQVKALGSQLTRRTINSVTVGLSEGAGIGGAIGMRDADGDGDTDWCVKLGYDPITVGVCVDAPF